MRSIKTLEKMAIAGMDGRNWYEDAAKDILQASIELRTNPKKLADLLALYSPRVSVKRSIRMALHYITTGEHAHDVMLGIKASVNHWEMTGEIRGVKTEPFSHAILGDGNAVVLDVWMARAIGIDQKKLANRKVYALLAKLIARVAKNLDWTPAQVQAAIWHTAVREAGRNPGKLNVTAELKSNVHSHVSNVNIEVM